MILADTSIWADYIGRGDALMSSLIEAGRIVLHPYVLGEIAMGSIANRAVILEYLRELPEAAVAEPDELLGFVQRHALFGTGVGYVDAHLLASVTLMPGAGLWTRDKRLLAAAERLGVAARPLN